MMFAFPDRKPLSGVYHNYSAIFPGVLTLGRTKKGYTTCQILHQSFNPAHIHYVHICSVTSSRD